MSKRAAAVAVLAAAAMAMAQAAAVFESDFSKAEPGSIPAELLVLDGQFAVKEEGGNRFLELPGSPLETFGVLFGPSQKEGLTVSARVHGTGAGRRFPTFAVSLGGVSGYRLQMAPAKKLLEILKGDAPVASAPWPWASGQWTHLRLQLSKTGDAAWTVRGKAWTEGQQEPKDWTVSSSLTQEPVAGKSGLWGCPFSGTAIRFDDVRVEAE